MPQRRPLCPFCSSHKVVAISASERLIEQECQKCQKRWSEMGIDRHTEVASPAVAPPPPVDRIPKWSPS